MKASRINTRMVQRLFALLTVGAGAFLARSSAATTQPAILGHGWGGEDACFTSSNAEVYNACAGTTHKYLIPIAITSGSHTFSVRADDSGLGSHITCRAFTMNGNNAATWTSATKSTTTAGLQTLSFGTRTVATGESAQIECDMTVDSFGGFGYVINASY